MQPARRKPSSRKRLVGYSVSLRSSDVAFSSCSPGRGYRVGGFDGPGEVFKDDTKGAAGMRDRQQEEFSQFMAFISNRGWRADFSGDGEVISPTGQKVAIPTKRDSEGCWVNDYAEARQRVARVEAAH